MYVTFFKYFNIKAKHNIIFIYYKKKIYSEFASFLLITLKKIEFVKIFYVFLTKVLRCPKYNLKTFGKCLSVCVLQNQKRPV